MKVRPILSSFISALCLALILVQTALPQSLESRPRRAETSLAFNGNPNTSDNGAAAEGENGALDTLVPGEGLRFYFEARGSSLIQMAQSANALSPMMKMMAGPLRASANDFSAFALNQMGTLAKAKIAFVGYGTDGAAAIIEAANPADAESLRAGVAQLLGGRANSAAGRTGVAVRGRVLFAGNREVVTRFSESDGAYSLDHNPLFVRARERFNTDPLFAYVEVNAPLTSAMPSAGEPAEMAGMLTGFGMPASAMAMGGRMEGDMLAVHAIMFMNKQRNGMNPFAGLFSPLTSEGTAGPMRAANFAAADTDMLMDFRLDWDKVLQSFESLFATFAGARSNTDQSASEMQVADPIGKMEQMLGFSIRNDLLPTLGNEAAVSLSGFDSMFTPSRSAQHATKAPTATRVPPRFMVMVALKDSTKFEKLMAQFFTKMGAPAMARTAYHGATINSFKSVTYAVTKDFFLIGNSAAEIRRSLDAGLMGNSLTTLPAYRAATSSTHETSMQLYLSSAVATKLFEALQTETAKATASVKDLAQPSATASVAGLGISVTPDTDGLLMEMRAPANLAFAAMAALATGKPAPPAKANTNTDKTLIPLPAGFGIPASATTAAPRRPDGSNVPKMTDDDIVLRKP